MFAGYYLGDNCIQNFHLRRYISGYRVGNLILRQPGSRVVKRDFQTYIQPYNSPNENFEYGYPHSNALLQFRLKLGCCKPHKATHQPTKCGVIKNVKLFRRKFLTLSYQTSRYKSKCIRMHIKIQYNVH